MALLQEKNEQSSILEEITEENYRFFSLETKIFQTLY